MIKAGFARLDITPPLGTPISGYFKPRYAKGVLDALEINALAFGNGEDAALIISCDVVAIAQDHADEIRTEIAQRTGVAADHVMLCALHQHTAICLGGRDIFFPVQDKIYLNMLYRKLGDVAQMALDDMAQARVLSAAAETPVPLGFVRRYYLQDGSVCTNPSPAKLPLVTGRCDESDNTVRLLRFVREGKGDIALVNFSTHPDVIAGSRFSADWPGFVCRFVEGDHQNVHCISVTGFQGDSNHIDFLTPEEKRFPAGKGYAHSRYMGRVIADTVKNIWEKGTEHTGDAIFGEVRVAFNKTNTAGIEYYDEAKAYAKGFDAGDPQKTAHVRDIATAIRILDLKKAPIYQRVVLTVLGLGDIAFVGIGGEPFGEYAIATRAAAKDKTVLCSCCTNGYQGYLPHDRAFAEGGYEVNNTFFTPGLEQQCITPITEMLNKF